MSPPERVCLNGGCFMSGQKVHTDLTECLVCHLALSDPWDPHTNVFGIDSDLLNMFFGSKP